METKETAGDRLKRLMEQKGVSGRETAKAAGITGAGLSKFIRSGGIGIGADLLHRIASYLGADPWYILYGTERKADTGGDVVSIPEYSVVFGAGEREEPTYEEAHDVVPALYPRAFFQRLRVRPESCRRFLVRGDSMKPLLLDGDHVLVDCSPQEIADGRIYCFWSPVGGMRVKRLIRLTDGGLVVRSENPTYADECLPPVDASRVRIVGRVIERSGQILTA